eukprot:12138560-Heterocapsa_arctica.AAC.1
MPALGALKVPPPRGPPRAVPPPPQPGTLPRAASPAGNLRAASVPAAAPPPAMWPPASRPPFRGQIRPRPASLQTPLARQEFAEPRPKAAQPLPRPNDFPTTPSNPLLGDPNPADRDVIL